MLIAPAGSVTGEAKGLPALGGAFLTVAPERQRAILQRRAPTAMCSSNDNLTHYNDRAGVARLH
ncbi:hypothetical protein [Kushneria aurantia]|uniref:Uncharacterized protein n=1 Tax=Kushneria aurantia TaxID=504092 RepID=A0ABV6G6P2_9GAMM